MVHYGKAELAWSVGIFNSTQRRDSPAMIGSVARGFGTSEEARWHWGEVEWAMMGRPSWPEASVFF